MAEPLLGAQRTAAAAALALLAACIAETALPTMPNAPSAGVAHGRPGILRLDGNCVRLETSTGPLLVVWRHGASVDYSTAPPIVTDGGGGSARIGERVILRGADTGAGASLHPARRQGSSAAAEAGSS